MSNEPIIEAARAGECRRLADLLAEGVDVNSRDEQGWTALNFAAGRGDVASVRLLLEHGADPSVTGRDLRTPLMIAKAADREEVVKILTQEEQKRGIWEDPRESRLYCRAYPLAELRRFPHWSEDEAAWPEGETAEDDSVAYLHQDLTVTRSMWPGEQVVYSDVGPAWKAFCEGPLEFAIPEDLL